MITVPSREELLSLFEQKQEEYTENIKKRMADIDWNINVQVPARIINNQGFITDMNPLVEAITKLVVIAGAEAVCAYIDIIADSSIELKQSKSTKEPDTRKLTERVERLEKALIKTLRFLPSDWESPTEPRENDN